MRLWSHSKSRDTFRKSEALLLKTAPYFWRITSEQGRVANFQTIKKSTAVKIGFEHVTTFLSKHISKGVIDVKFSPDVSNNRSHPHMKCFFMHSILPPCVISEDYTYLNSLCDFFFFVAHVNWMGCYQHLVGRKTPLEIYLLRKPGMCSVLILPAVSL